ncbi:hypothetical protein GGX14DRAFT_480801 [Mycena pura]|uniref:HMG box domain-containing protein n=1 Tax=Mycena pura TaxID=153505 RepID=A0AAD6Y558_9AGAR|nr:hypothetical protein GGX14DRAFT_480801 [Mycena pura]
MPAVRLSLRRGSAVSRRRSSLATSFAKPGTYGYTPPSPAAAAAVTFAPNVTPISYSAPSRSPSPLGSPSLTTDQPLPLFPPSETPAPAPTRKRAPPGRRRSQGYVPRPPNAFMLFRADFVRQKHVPGSIETNHGSLSKIIGNCWRALPLPEKHIWEVKAKHAKAEHKLKYPDYKFRPVHNKNRTAARSQSSQPASAPAKGQLSPEEDERRCEEVAALLLQGKKGQELASAIRDLDWRRTTERVHEHDHSSPSPVPAYEHQQYDLSSKYPHPLNLDPLYYPLAPSPPSSTFTGSHSALGSSAGSPYVLPTPLHDGEEQTWHVHGHRRSSSVPLPNDYSYSFPPFMYGDQQGLGVTLPPLNFAASDSSAFPLPPPPTSADDSLAGMPMGISASGRMSYSWANAGSGSSFAYPRPSFSFLFGGGGGGRPSFSAPSYYGYGTHNPVGRRASSAQAFFSPTSFKFPESAAAADAVQQGQEQQHGSEPEEDLPDADTSLFDAGFLSSFGAPAAASDGSSVDDNEGVSPFGAAPVVHAPQPVHAVSPLGVDFAQPQPQTYEQPQYEPQQQQHVEAYPPFEFPGELELTHESLLFESRTASASATSSAAYDMEMEMSTYANEFV